MTSYDVAIRCEVIVVVDPSAEYAIDRYVGLPPDNDLGWAEGRTRDNILEYLAVSCVAYNRDDASRLDGFADLAPGLITMYDHSYSEADY